MEMVDMQLLAAKAAQEFTVLAKENDILLKENMRMKENYDDIQYEREKLLLELSNMDKLKSKAKQWELEKKILMEHLETTETRTKRDNLLKENMRMKEKFIIDIRRCTYINDGITCTHYT
eukprot:301813_1